MKRRDFNKGVALAPASGVLVPFTGVATVATAATATSAAAQSEYIREWC